jgi:hypothetical protein
MSSLVGPTCRVHIVSVCRAGLRVGRLDRLWPGELSSLFFCLAFLFYFSCFTDLDSNLNSYLFCSILNLESFYKVPQVFYIG